jgi:carbamoyl-phosphate synthase small subunit
MESYLVLEDGSIYWGDSFGAVDSVHGEVVFNTSMTGYQEMLTDPSYAGQIVIPTYPLIGNYGINQMDQESAKIQVAGFVVRSECREPSHILSEETLDSYLKRQGIPGVSGLDTRAVARRLRIYGVMRGMIGIDGNPGDALEKLREVPAYGTLDFASLVSSEKVYEWDRGDDQTAALGDIVVVDCGVKFNILRILSEKGWNVKVVPIHTDPRDILSLNPDGVLISPGPGDPVNLQYAVANVAKLVGRVPLFGICLGQQLLGRALGADTYKLKFGHRGGNHPVKDLLTNRTFVTAQNHGYAINPDSMPSTIRVTHTNLNDLTIEGIQDESNMVMAVQYHSESSPGPKDNEDQFDTFLDMVKRNK